MEWTATPDPGVELAKNSRLREAAFRKQKEINKYVVGNVVKDIIETIIPLSMSANIIDILISRSVRQGKAGVIWLELEQDDQLREDIRARMIEEEEMKRKDAWDEARRLRLEKKEEKMTVWKEKQKMKNLITGLDDLKLETFKGEWEEHDLMDGWMLDVMVSSLGDDDVVMACEDASEEMEVGED